IRADDRANDLGAALLRARGFAEARRPGEWTQVLWVGKRRSDRADPVVPGCRFNARGDPYVYLRRQTGRTVMEARDGRQTSGTDGVDCARPASEHALACRHRELSMC